MPSSRANTIPYVINLINQLQPNSILDVGIGFGKWGYLFREYTDIVKSELDPARYAKKNWQVQIDGIEGYKEYLHEGHDFIYNNIYIGNALDVLAVREKYDVIFLGDIIEHFSMEEGKVLMRMALERSKQCVILTTPRYETYQSDLCDNPLERHKSVWEPKDFRTIDNCLIALADKGTYVVAYPALLENHLKLEIKQNKPQVSYIVRTIKNCLRPVKRYLVKKLTK